MLSIVLSLLFGMAAFLAIGSIASSCMAGWRHAIILTRELRDFRDVEIIRAEISRAGARQRGRSRAFALPAAA